MASPPSTSTSAMPSLPLVEVRYENLEYAIQKAATSASATIPTVGSTALNVATGPFKALARLAMRSAPAPKSVFKVLDGVSGVLRPGTMTLMLAPPGHGKSALMKALTGILPAKELKGTVSYSGIVSAEAAGAGVHVGSLAQYVQQIDE